MEYMISRFQLGHDQSYGDLSTEMFGKRRWWRYNIVIGQIHVVLFTGQQLGSVLINSKTRIKTLRLIFLFHMQACRRQPVTHCSGSHWRRKLFQIYKGFYSSVDRLYR